MRRTALQYALAITATAAIAAPTGYALATPTATPATTRLDEIPKRGVLRVCTTGDYRPFTHLTPQKTYEGLDIQMADLLAKSLDAKTAFTPTTWATIVQDIAASKCDIAVGGVSITPERARKVYFSTPYLTDGKTPIVRCADKDRYQTLKDIDRPNVRVVVNPGGTNEQFARANIGKADLRVHPDNTTIFEEIAADRADVMMTDATETRYQQSINKKLCAAHPEKPFTFSEKAYALPRGDEEFKSYVDQWLHLTLKDGTFTAQAKPWLH